MDSRPFINRPTIQDCLGSLARDAALGLVRLERHLGTKYWGERVFQVRDEQGLPHSALESTLTPADDDAGADQFSKVEAARVSAARFALFPGTRF